MDKRGGDKTPEMEGGAGGRGEVLTTATTTTAEAEAGVRIFVGGLGESVNGDDVRKIFAPLGRIQSLQFIRSKARSFAYVDFFPTSPKSLFKLFSTYNGCVWKGGRLRLDKAKEHYLARLRREWEEDALLASSVSPTDVDFLTDKESSEKPKKELSSEKRRLRIFFPRLRKVKSIPFSGTGKHKYSFRRVEVPSLPTHFCDCEEHSGLLQAAEEKQIPILEEQGGGMDDEEINLMNSVMNKLLQGENVPDNACGEIELAKEVGDSIKAIDDLQLDVNEGDSTADEDNLVLNIVSRGRKKFLANQESNFNKRQVPKDGPSESVPKMQRRNASSSKKKRESVHHEENDRNKYTSAISGGELAEERDNSIKAIDDLQLDVNEGDSTADEDNLVLNIVSQGKKRVLANQLSSFNKKVVPNDGRNESMPKMQRRNASSPKKKRESVHHGENDRNEHTSTISGGELAKEGDNSIKTIDDVQLDENDGDSTADEDNFVLNIVSQGQKMVLASQESSFNKRQVPKDGPTQSVPKMNKKNASSPNKKRKSVHHEENDRNECISAISGGKGHSLPLSNGPGAVLGSQLMEPESGVKHSTPSLSCSQNTSQREQAGNRRNSTFNISDKLPSNLSGMEEQSKSDNMTNCNDEESNKFSGHENQKDQLGKAKKKEELAEAQPIKPDSASSKDGRGSAWVQKSSWTQLVGGTNSSSFSITQILPAMTFEEKEPAKPDGMRVPNSIGSMFEEGQSDSPVNDTTDLGVKKESDVKMNLQTVVVNNKASAPVAEKIRDSSAKQICNKDAAIGDTCSFMRSAASLKEWAHIKAAISGSRKRKSHEQ